MTMTADGTAQTLQPGDAREVLREMAAVVRTVFGASLQASRQATPPVAADAAPQQPQAVVTTPEPPVAAPGPVPVAPVAPAAAAPAPGGPASIPMPTIPLPDVPSEAVTENAEPATDPVVAPAAPAAPETTGAGAEVEQPVEADEAPAAYVGEVPALRLVPNPPETRAPAAPVPTVSAEHRQAVLREVAFLDDL
jgi:hypothetical protein